MKKNRIYPNYLIIPPIAIFLIFLVLPSTVGYLYAFTDWNQYVSDVSWVGFANFKEIFQGKSLGIAFVNTIIFGVVKPIVVTILGFVFALSLNRKIKTRNVLRTLYFIPAIFCALVVGLIFSALFHTESGAINLLLANLGVKKISWFGSRWPAMFVMNLAEIWRSVGYAVVITLAGLQSVSSEVMEAAVIDGANGWNKFRYVTLPLIMPSVNVNILYSLIYALKMFDLVLLMTRGGPGNQTETLGTLVMSEMARGKYAQSTAINVVFTIFLIVIAVLYQKVSSRWESVD